MSRLQIVTAGEFESVIDRLKTPGVRAFDTETTGLRVYGRDRLFSLIISDASTDFYFNFQPYDNWETPPLEKRLLLSLASVFANPYSYWYAHNAKFDLAVLAQENIFVGGVVHDTEALARLLRNDHMQYRLADCAKRIGLEKDDAVEKYILENHLWEWEQQPGKATRSKKKFFDMVPPEIIMPYGGQDGYVTFALGESQQSEFIPEMKALVQNEKELTKVIFEMEFTGIKINRKYCEENVSRETIKFEDAKKRFQTHTGITFIDSGKCLLEAFTREGAAISRTAKGNPSFTDAVLEKIDTPTAQVVRDYREALKRCNTYFKNLLYMADSGDRIHPNFRQGGTATGRLSCKDPNLQNVPKGEQGAHQIRRAFVPTKGFVFVMADFDQMEYRLMLDYAGETEVIEKVKAGLDVHAATAEMMGVGREQAKTLNFMLLYGGGTQKLADALKISLTDAKELKRRYFRNLPHVADFIERVIRTAKERKFIFNWTGRRCHFLDPNFAYAAPNHLIQGGCADIVKFAMVKLSRFLYGKKSRMLLQIHDEVLFEIHESEFHIVPELKRIMESIYPFKHLPLTCGVEHSFISWADKVEGLPIGEKTGDTFQRESFEAIAGAPQDMGRENPAGIDTRDPGYSGLH